MKFKKTIKLITIYSLSIILLFSLTGCSTEEPSLNEKATNEVEYLGSKFVIILNRLNNITFENYQITTEQAKLTKDSAEQEKSSSSVASQSGEQGDGGQEGSNSGGQSGQTDEDTTIIASQMSPNTILNPTTTEIDWAGLKNEVENLYYAWNTILLDLYQLETSNDDILGFSADLDKATTYIKNEDKANSLLAVANLYGYLPRYLETVSDDEAKKNVTRTISFILNSYAFVETGDWDSVRSEINKAEETFRLVTNDVNFVSSNSYRVNKTYVLLNELKNSLSLEDKDIFYIKYRNLLEEINQL